MVLIHDRIIIIDICNFEMSYKTPEKYLKSNQIYSVVITIELICYFYLEENEGKETVQENTLIVAADEGLDENKGTL